MNMCNGPSKKKLGLILAFHERFEVMADQGPDKNWTKIEDCGNETGSLLVNVFFQLVYSIAAQLITTACRQFVV